MSCEHDCPPVPDGEPRSTVQPNKQALLQRLSRIEGQIRGIAGMVDSDRYCMDVLTQIQAARAALDAVSNQLLQDHLRGCVRRAIQAGDGDAALDEVFALLARRR